MPTIVEEIPYSLSSTEYNFSVEGKSSKLHLIIDHNPVKKQIAFTLHGARLPGEMGRDFFVYEGEIVEPKKAVREPRIAGCASPMVRTFLTGLVNQGKFHVERLSLSQTVVLYGMHTDYREVARLYRTALQAAFSIEKSNAIYVHFVKESAKIEQ